MHLGLSCLKKSNNLLLGWFLNSKFCFDICLPTVFIQCTLQNFVNAYSVPFLKMLVEVYLHKCYKSRVGATGSLEERLKKGKQ